MIIEKNQKELDAMEQFHKGNCQEGLRLQEEFAAAFREAYKNEDHCPVKKPAATMETVRNAWPFTGPIRNMCPTACGLSSTQR